MARVDERVILFQRSLDVRPAHWLNDDLTIVDSKKIPQLTCILGYEGIRNCKPNLLSSCQLLKFPRGFGICRWMVHPAWTRNMSKNAVNPSTIHRGHIVFAPALVPGVGEISFSGLRTTPKKKSDGANSTPSMFSWVRRGR